MSISLSINQSNCTFTTIADLIEYLVQQSEQQNLEVDFLGQQIQEPFNCCKRHFKHRLTFLNGKFENGVSFEYAICEHNLQFINCAFQESETIELHSSYWRNHHLFQINQFAHLTVKRDLIFSKCNVFGKCDFYQCTVVGYVRVFDECVFGKLSMRRCSFGQLRFNAQTKVYGFFSLQDTIIEQHTELFGFYANNMELERGTFKSHFDISQSQIGSIKAHGAIFEGTFLAIGTEVQSASDFTTVEFKGICNCSNAIFAKGVHFLDASFYRNTFFNRTFLGPFSIFRRTSFMELVNFQVHPDSSVIWEALLFQGMLELDRSLEQLPEFSDLKSLDVLDRFCHGIFLAWKNDNAQPKQKQLSFPDVRKRTVSPEDIATLQAKYPLVEHFEYYQSSSKKNTPIQLPEATTIYEQYLISEIAIFLRQSGYYRPTTKAIPNAIMLTPNSTFEQLPAVLDYEICRLQEKWKRQESERLYDAEAICGVLKMGYRAALNEDAEDWAFRKSRSFEKEREGGIQLWLQSLAGYGTQPMQGTVFIGVLLILLMMTRGLVSHFFPAEAGQHLSLLENSFTTIKLFLASENEPALNPVLGILDVGISMVGLLCVTFWIIAISHRVIRN